MARRPRRSTGASALEPSEREERRSRTRELAAVDAGGAAVQAANVRVSLPRSWRSWDRARRRL